MSTVSCPCADAAACAAATRAATRVRTAQDDAFKLHMSIIQNTGNPTTNLHNIQRQSRRQNRWGPRELATERQLAEITARNAAADAKAKAAADIVAAIALAQQNANGLLFAPGATDVPNAPDFMQNPNQPHVALNCKQLSDCLGIPVNKMHEIMGLEVMDLGSFDVESDFDSASEGDSDATVALDFGDDDDDALPCSHVNPDGCCRKFRMCIE